MIVPNAAAACPYRVGDYLFSENATHPSTSWPGTSWVQVQGRMILGADASHIAGSTVGGSDADRRSAAENQRSYLCRRRKQWGRWQRLGRIPRRHGSLLAQRSNAIWAACAKSKRRIPIRQCILIRGPQHRRRPAPQQHAALPRSVHLAADCVTPERGCAAA